MTEGDLAHAHAVWNIDTFFPRRLHPVDEDAGRAQHQVTVGDVLCLDVGVGDEIHVVEDLGDGQIEWRQTNGIGASAVKEDIDAQAVNELSGVEAEESLVGPQSPGVVLRKATHHIRNAWSAVNRCAPLLEGRPTKR